MQGVRILDLTRVLAGPWAVQQLADQGADVIKVEPPEGDETRTFGPLVHGHSTYFLCANRNKRTITLDLKTDADREVLYRLAAGADVVVENWRTGVAERLGVGWEALRAHKPDLVYVAIRAFGEDDPAWAGRPGYDLLLQHMGGTTSITGFPGDPPTKHGSSVADLFAGCFAAQAVLQGLLHRERTGEGQRIVINMMQVQAQVLAYHASRFFVTGEVDRPRGNAHAGIVPYDVYRCRDGWFVVACANDAQFGRLRRALSLPDVPGWQSAAGRLADRAQVDAAVAEAVRDRAAYDLDVALRDADVPGGPVLDPAGALGHPSVGTVQMEHPVFGALELPGPAYQSKTTVREHRPPPERDEHRAAILAGQGWAP